MLGTEWVAGGVPLNVWRIEDIAVESVTARWLAWYYGVTQLGPNAAISKSQFKRLCLKIHPDKVSTRCFPLPLCSAVVQPEAVCCLSRASLKLFAVCPEQA